MIKPLFAFLISLICVPLFAQQSKSTPAVDFNRDVKPLLSDRCFLCHGPDEGTREADLRLDTEEGASAVIEAGDVDGSDLIYRILAEDDDQMPPADSNLALSDEEKEILKRWISEGAKWEQHWAFVAPVKSTPPETKRKDWASSEIDQFVLSRLEAEKLSPAPMASKAKLLRRVSFDLTGLPPTLEALDAFLGDESESAYEKAIDRLLASSSYGERMTADWLDVARYSDTYGYQVDRDRFVWPWRDWVVRSFNKNMPYDQFVTEQIAGDLLPNATDDQILATTFNRLHPHSDVLAVPIQAVASFGRKKFAFVQNGGGEFEPQEVTIGKSNISFVAIESGLEEDSVVALDAYQRALMNFGEEEPEEEDETDALVSELAAEGDAEVGKTTGESESDLPPLPPLLNADGKKIERADGEPDKGKDEVVKEEPSKSEAALESDESESDKPEAKAGDKSAESAEQLEAAPAEPPASLQLRT